MLFGISLINHNGSILDSVSEPGLLLDRRKNTLTRSPPPFRSIFKKPVHKVNTASEASKSFGTAWFISDSRPSRQASSRT